MSLTVTTIYILKKLPTESPRITTNIKLPCQCLDQEGGELVSYCWWGCQKFITTRPRHAIECRPNRSEFMKNPHPHLAHTSCGLLSCEPIRCTVLQLKVGPIWWDLQFGGTCILNFNQSLKAEGLLTK